MKNAKNRRGKQAARSRQKRVDRNSPPDQMRAVPNTLNKKTRERVEAGEISDPRLAGKKSKRVRRTRWVLA